MRHETAREAAAWISLDITYKNQLQLMVYTMDKLSAL